MKITVEFIDRKGFWHIFRAKSKKLLQEAIKAFAPGTSVTWTAKNYCIISQQYC